MGFMESTDQAYNGICLWLLGEKVNARSRSNFQLTQKRGQKKKKLFPVRSDIFRPMVSDVVVEASARPGLKNVFTFWNERRIESGLFREYTHLDFKYAVTHEGIYRRLCGFLPQFPRFVSSRRTVENQFPSALFVFTLICAWKCLLISYPRFPSYTDIFSILFWSPSRYYHFYLTCLEYRCTLKI